MKRGNSVPLIEYNLKDCTIVTIRKIRRNQNRLFYKFYNKNIEIFFNTLQYFSIDLVQYDIHAYTILDR